MASLQDLREVYESFCSFGSSRNLATGSMSDISGPQMDNQKFSKFAKDCKIIDGKKVTTTDVDILFNKCKAKGARRLDWDHFLTAFDELAVKKYPSKNSTDAHTTLFVHVMDKGPVARGVTLTETNSGVYSRMTDHTGYTGTHKQRFDENGVGRGAAGRQTKDQIDLTNITNRETNSNISHNTYNGRRSTTNISGSNNNTSVGSAKKRGTASVVTASEEQINLKSSQPKRADMHSSQKSLNKASSNGNMRTSTTSLSGSKSVSNSTSTLSGTRGGKLGSTGNIANRKTTTTTTTTTTSFKATGAKGSNGSVFDRLTDSSGYTGSHKHRFNADGTGRGAAGRTQNTGSLTLQGIVRN